MRNFVFTTSLALLLSVSQSFAAQTIDMEDCLMEAVRDAAPQTTVGELRELCREKTSQVPAVAPGPVGERLAVEAKAEQTPWAITPHKPNYILPVAYNDRLNTEPFEEVSDDARELQDTEVKFQISFKFPVVRNLFDDRANVYFAYTNQSWWQLYADDISSPFRDTNHEPEVFLRINNDWQLWGLRNSLIDLGFVHQSNGRAEPLSRSWNRLFANFVFEKDNLALGIKPWLIVGDTDDNPDIEDFLGYGEVRAAYLWRRNTFTTLLRNNLQTSDNRGAVELTWSRPLAGVLRFYAQYYYGYGESLVDYNARVNRIGIGLSVNDYLWR